MPKRKKTEGSPLHAESRTRSFSVAAPQQDPSLQMRTVSSEDIVAELKATGRGWTEDIRGLLAVPPQLFVRKSAEGSYYSKDLRFGITEILSGLDSGPIKARPTDYGIALYSTGGGVYFVLADLGRRIIIRERLFSIHDKPPERDWKEIKERIRDALSIAAGDKGHAVVSDGMVRKVSISPP